MADNKKQEEKINFEKQTLTKEIFTSFENEIRF